MIYLYTKYIQNKQQDFEAASACIHMNVGIAGSGIIWPKKCDELIINKLEAKKYPRSIVPIIIKISI